MGVCEVPFLSSPGVVSPVVTVIPLTEAVPVFQELRCIFVTVHIYTRVCEMGRFTIRADLFRYSWMVPLEAKQTASSHQANTKHRRDGKFLVAVESYLHQQGLNGVWQIVCSP